ncbi:helix-turn-helix domain-containing protein [Amycolatopsis sp. cmx-4-83]|uniref:helix-turn-helix domain-containing protein n=1 Tax=Amycolatopsis sp. cmx-4-83 TaxID=2790940 RepID=UPI00397E719E
MAGNTPKAKAIGTQLRVARGKRSQRDVATQLGWNHLKIHRAETGERPLEPDDLGDLIVALGAPLDIATKLMSMASSDDDRGWFASGRTEQQRQADALLGLEAVATRIVTVSPLLVPGPLQHPAYTRSILRRAGVPEVEIARRVAERQGRGPASFQRREDPAELIAFVDAGVFKRTLGDHELLDLQLDLLLVLSELPTVTIRAIPFNAEWTAELEGPFSVLYGPDSTVIHREDRLAGLFLHDPDQVKVYTDTLPQLEEVAMSPAATARLIAESKSPGAKEETTT